METANFILGILCGTVLCGLCYVIVELLKISKTQKAKENEIAEAFRQLQSVEKEFDNTHHSIDENVKEANRRWDDFIEHTFRQDMEAIHRKIEENINIIHRDIDIFKKFYNDQSYAGKIEFQKAIDNLHDLIVNTKLELREKDSTMRGYVDSRIDKTSRGVELVAEGLRNYYDEEEFADRVLAKLLVKQKEENIKRVTEGLPVSGAPTHYGK